MRAKMKAVTTESSTAREKQKTMTLTILKEKMQWCLVPDKTPYNIRSRENPNFVL